MLGWKWDGSSRPPFAEVPSSGQESVWDYPRPPRLEADARLVAVSWDGREVARSLRALRLCETASPPTFYLPPEDVDSSLLESESSQSFCEWKGQAVYWSLSDGRARCERVGWSYPSPSPAYSDLAGYLSFYPARLVCEVDGERVRPQPGGFYGGWVTSEVVGPYKGEPGTGGW